jgi:para-nitrobenzyl esterase
MMEAWLAFARSGDPNPDGFPTWEPFDDTRRATMLFDRESAVEDAPLDAERRAWEGIL